MPTIAEVEQALTLLSEKIDEIIARIHAGYLVLEEMKKQMEMMREKLKELKIIKTNIENQNQHKS